MAKSLAGETIQEVMAVNRAEIKMEVADDDSCYSSIDAGVTRILTRRLHRSDNLCGTDISRMVYPALARITNERAAYTLENSFRSLGQSWVDVRRFEDRNRPSAVIGQFAL
jgi:hypothetical protein